MLEQLFGSKTRLRLLRIFFRDPGKAFFVRELTRLLSAQINGIRRELEALTTAGLIEEVAAEATTVTVPATTPQRKYYRLNQGALLYPELHALLMKEQIMGEQEFAQELKIKGGDIKLILVTGRFTNDHRSPSDILIVGALKDRAIARIIEFYEQQFGFAIRYTCMTEQEFYDRRQMMDKFLYSLFEAEHVNAVNLLGV